MNTIHTASPLALDALERLAHRRARMRLGWLTHAFVFVAVNLLLAILAAASGNHWSVHPLFGWGLGLAVHGVVVFLATGGLGLQDRMVRHERERLMSQRGGR